MKLWEERDKKEYITNPRIRRIFLILKKVLDLGLELCYTIFIGIRKQSFQKGNQMCGIIGFFNRKASKNSHWDSNIIFETIMHFRRKGTDGIGILVINDDDWFIHKVHQNQAEFILTFGSRLKQIIEDPKTRAIIIHNRWATHGNVDEHGCHPFVGQRYILMHNGSIQPTLIRKVEGAEYNCDSDSERICALLNENIQENPETNIKNVIHEVYNLSKKIGILVIYDTFEDYLYVFRTNEREFVFSHTKQNCITRLWNDSDLAARYVNKDRTIIGHGTMLKIDPSYGEIVKTFKNIVPYATNYVYRFDPKKGYKVAQIKTDTLPIYGEESVVTINQTSSSSPSNYDELYGTNYDAINWYKDTKYNKKSKGKGKGKDKRNNDDNEERRCYTFDELKKKYRSNYEECLIDDPNGFQPDPDERMKNKTHKRA